MKYSNLRTFAPIAMLTMMFAVAPRAEIIEQIIVKVNGEILTKSELENRQISALRQMGQNIDAKANPTDAQLKQMLDQVTPQLLVNAVDEMLLVQRGHELGYRMADDQFQSVLESIKKDNKIETDEQLQAALKAENMTLADLRRSLERQMIVSRVQQNEVMSKIAVNDEEARKYYETHLAEFTAPRTVTLREIFVNVPSDGQTINVGLDEQGRDKILSIRQRALNGESYETLASELSDAPSKANGGLIGPLSLDELSPELQEMIEGMKPGEITQPLRGAKGYQILKLENATTAETKSFDEAREEISNRVFTDKRRDEFEKYLQKLRAQAIIEWKNADAKRAYDQGLASPRPAAES